MTYGHSKTFRLLGATLIGLVFIISNGCSTEPKRVEADYGNSVNQMVQASTYDPEAAASTESVPVIGMDGKRAVRSLDALQTDIERVEKFEEILSIDLGD